MAFGAFLAPTALCAADVCPLPSPPWKMERQQGPDFDVCRYQADGEDAFFGIYVGLHPQFHPPKNKRGLAGSVGGVAVEWFDKAPGTGATTLGQDAIIPPFGITKPEFGLTGHVWIYAPTEEKLRAVRDVVGSVAWPPFMKGER